MQGVSGRGAGLHFREASASSFHAPIARRRVDMERDRLSHVASPRLAHSLIWLLRCASISFFSSSGVSFGRSIVSVSLSSLPVKRNGT